MLDKNKPWNEWNTGEGETEVRNTFFEKRQSCNFMVVEIVRFPIYLFAK